MAKHTCLYIHIHLGCIHKRFPWLNIEDDQYNDRPFYTDFLHSSTTIPPLANGTGTPRDMDDLASSQKRDMWID